MKPTRVAYVFNVCMHYQVPVLSRLQSRDGIELAGVFGQSHWPVSKLRSVTGVRGFRQIVLPTLDVFMPYRGRGLHLFWNPTLGRWLRRLAPDVMIAGASNFPNNLQLMRHARRTGTPYIWHGLGSMYKKKSLLRRLGDRTLRRFLEGAACGLAFNGESRDYYVEHYGLDPERILVATNVVDADRVFAERERWAGEIDALRRELGLEGRKVVLFVGVIEPAKRLDRLLRAFGRIRATVPDAALLVVGDGRAAPDMKRLAGQLGLANVLFAGKQVEKANLYFMLGDVFVLPGLGGLAISQAMAHGMPLLSARADGTEKDLIAEGENGWLLDETNAEDQIVAHVVTLLQDEPMRRRMGATSRRRIEERFNQEKTVDTFVRAIALAAGAPPRPATPCEL